MPKWEVAFEPASDRHLTIDDVLGELDRVLQDLEDDSVQRLETDLLYHSADVDEMYDALQEFRESRGKRERAAARIRGATWRALCATHRERLFDRAGSQLAACAQRLMNSINQSSAMAVVVLVFTEPVVKDGRAYNAQVCGRPVGHLWEGWIEFAATDGREVLRTARETTQPNRNALEYWAGGLSMTYLEAALTRAMDPSLVAPRDVIATPHFAGPAPSVVIPEPVGPTRAVLDPYAVAAKGETYLRQQLGALRPQRLVDILRDYDLAEASVELETLTKSELIDLIVEAVVRPV